MNSNIKKNILIGAVIYSSFDAIAALIISEFSFTRLFGMMIIGATIYSYEIPTYFKWIENKSINLKYKKISKPMFALIYFNPIWIARHLFFIDMLTYGHSDYSIIIIATKSFIVNIPISLITNYLIQNYSSLDYRYTLSAFYSGIMAIYYALSKILFQ